MSHGAFASICSSAASGTAPDWLTTGFPSLNTITVGIPRIPYCCAVCGLASVSSLATSARPTWLAASWSTNGAIILQGPHQSA